jgi:uncharacterized protein YecE (DUF72 family)
MPSDDQLSLLPDGTAKPIGNRFYVGTCSWAEKSFVRSDFYPPAVRSPADRLRYYATRFPTVEVDASYFALLPSAYARGWVETTPPGFVMNAKAFGLFTGHAIRVDRLPPRFDGLLPARMRGVEEVRLDDTSEEFVNACWDRFREFLAPLAAANRLGYVLFQLPPSTRYAPDFLDVVHGWRRELPGYHLAVEFRHRDWSRHPEVYQALTAVGVIYVMVDLPDLPWLMPLAEEVTADWAVIRFHGRNREGWAKARASTDQRYDYAYTKDELRIWAALVERAGGRTSRVFAMFNNHVRGNMARNAQVLQELLAAGTAPPVTAAPPAPAPEARPDG